MRLIIPIIFYLLSISGVEVVKSVSKVSGVSDHVT